jgi:hypothetical protein
MSREQLEKQLARWKNVLLFYTGSAVTLLVIALVALPAINIARSTNNALLIDGWYGVWLVLELGCIAPGFMLLLAPSWRKLPRPLRFNPGFGFLACAWVALLAFDLRVAVLDVPVTYHFVVAGLGVVLLATYLLLKRKMGVGEELFP